MGSTWSTGPSIGQMISMSQNHKNTQNIKKHKTYRTKVFGVFVACFHFYVLFMIVQIISPRNVELPPCYGHWPSWWAKPVFSYSKPHTLSTYIRREIIVQKWTFTLSLYPGHLGYKQCYWKGKRSSSFHLSFSYLKERGGNWLVQRSSVCKSYHRYVAEGPGLEKINGKVIIKTIALCKFITLIADTQLRFTLYIALGISVCTLVSQPLAFLVRT